MSYAVYLGAKGWNHEAWRDSFYADDMPEDWQLAFYNTQFRCVYLDRAAWADLSSETWAQWANETQESFRFVLEPSGSAETDASAVAAFGGRAVLLDSVDDSRLVWFDAASDLRQVSTQLRGHAGEEAVFLLSRDADFVRMLEMRTMLELMGL